MKSHSDIGMNDPHFLFVSDVMVLDQDRRTYSLCRICIYHIYHIYRF